MIDPLLAEVLEEAGRTAHRLLVGSDYDGTLSPIVADPAQARPSRRALRALIELGSMPGVRTVIISGRSRSALHELLGEPDPILLIGSHGAEGLDEEPTRPDTVADVVAALGEVRDAFAGTVLEAKPAGAALHYRQAVDRDGAAAAARLVAGRLGARVIEGKMVVEALVGTADKGRAFSELHARWSPNRAVFFGDDVTDEDVFRAMAPPDVSVKVGPEPTDARFRVDDVDGVAECLEMLASARLRAGPG